MYSEQEVLWHVVFTLHQLQRCWCSLISVITRLQIEWPSQFQAGLMILHICRESTVALGPNCSGYWGLRCAASHTPPFSAKVKNVWGYTSTSSHAYIAWCWIKCTFTGRRQLKNGHWKTTINLFHSNTTIFYLPYWLLVLVIRSSWGYPFVKFKTGYV